ncbi:hypothetical protein Bhyg_06953 [Pseudolycoriella hygida]|uniref:Uncharacterized protein n=1 Tax=Pseudolycoriella hygida TaxID=35572 RepID=A0A9Q0N1S5_9DIPT|nr:hypothetical protein Bhyg_06953 [Pseudolycoriella hygida]
MCRSILSNLVPAANEVGKIYSLTTSLESISPLGSAPLYSYVYSNTLGTFPGAFNVISAGLYSINCILLIIVYIFLRRYPPVDYETVD